MKDLDIKLKLSEHQHSIMSDEITTALLAYIEKSGTTNEDELVKNTGLEKDVINKVLLRLYKNKFIQFGKKYLFISDEGKNIIDKLGFAKDIIQVSLDEFDFEKEEKEQLIKFLFTSRNLIYREYLKTVTDLRIWSTISQLGKMNRKRFKFERKIGALCHINRLYLTINHNVIEEKLEKLNFRLDVDKIFATSINEIINYEEGQQEKPEDDKSFILNWLNDIYEIDSKKKFNEEIKESGLKNLFISYSLPRYRVEYDNWCSTYFNHFDSINHISNIKRFNRDYKGNEFNCKSLILNIDKNRFQVSDNYLKSFRDTLELLSLSKSKKELSDFLSISEIELDGYLAMFGSSIEKLKSASNNS